MSDAETIAILLQISEGLDVLAEQLALLESVFGEKEPVVPVLLPDEMSGKDS